MAPADTSQTVMVVEDDDTTRASFGLALREQGYKVQLEANGAEAAGFPA